MKVQASGLGWTWSVRAAAWAIVLGGAGCVAPRAWSADFNEFVAGDLSNNPLAPTRFQLQAGGNLLTAGASSVDRDYLRLIVQPGDFTGDGLVNAGDLAYWRNEFGVTLSWNNLLVWHTEPGELAERNRGSRRPWANGLSLGEGSVGDNKSGRGPGVRPGNDVSRRLQRLRDASQRSVAATARR